jgi:hypothetical protein
MTVRFINYVQNLYTVELGYNVIKETERNLWASGLLHGVVW